MRENDHLIPPRNQRKVELRQIRCRLRDIKAGVSALEGIEKIADFARYRDEDTRTLVEHLRKSVTSDIAEEQVYLEEAIQVYKNLD